MRAHRGDRRDAQEVPPHQPVDHAHLPQRGHGLGSLVPYEPSFSGTNPNRIDLDGSTASANSLADAALWPQLLTFLHRYG